MARENFDNELERMLADRLDGELTSPDAKRLDELLAADSRARREAGEYERLDSLLRSHAKVVPPIQLAGLRSKVMEEVREEAERRAGRVRTFRFVAAAVPLAAAAVLAIVVSSSSWGRKESAPLAKGTSPPSVVATAKPVAASVVEVAFKRPGNADAPQLRSTISITFERSETLAKQTADRDAAESAKPEYAVASSTGPVTPVADLLEAPPI